MENPSLQTRSSLFDRHSALTTLMMHRMNQADEAMWCDMAFYKNKVTAELRKDMRYRSLLQACSLHSSDGWSWTEEMIDTVYGLECRTFSLFDARNWRTEAQ